MPKDMKGVMDEFKSGALHSGSKSGPVVTNRKQAIAIGLSEQRKKKPGSVPPKPAIPNTAPATSTVPMRGEPTPGLMATRNNLKGIRNASIAHIKRGSR
jgi:hypothetical protein